MMQDVSAGGSPASATPERRHWVSPDNLISRLRLNQGMTVADVGAGSGYFSLALARAVGLQGRVFAVESESALLAGLRSALDRPDAPTNIAVVEGTPVTTHIPDHCCDLVLLADVWHEVPASDWPSALCEAKRILGEEGHLAILEWGRDAPSPPAPPVGERLSFKQAVCAVEMGSWSLDVAAEIERLGYLLVMQPTDESVQS